MNDEQEKIIKGIFRDMWDGMGHDIIQALKRGGKHKDQHAIAQWLADYFPPGNYQHGVSKEDREAIEAFDKMPYAQMLKFIRDCGPFGE